MPISMTINIIIYFDSDADDHQYDNDDHQYNNDDHQRSRWCSVAPKCWLVGPHFQLTQRFTVTSQPQIAKQNSRQIFKYLSRWVVQCRIVCNQSEILLKIRADQSLQWKQILTKAVLDIINFSTFQSCSIVQLFNCSISIPISVSNAEIYPKGKTTLPNLENDLTRNESSLGSS